MWDTKPVIFEDEDEDKLITEFVRLCALYPARQAFEICDYLFRNLRDPELRSKQAAMIWSNDLAVQERIRLAKLNDGAEPQEWTKEKLQARILAVTEDDTIGYQQKKAMIEGYMSIAQMEGLIVKSVDKKVDNKNRPNLPTIVFAQYSDQ